MADAPAPPPAPPAGTEARQDAAIAELRTEQGRQGGVLDELLGLVKGGAGPAPAAKGDPPPAPAVDMAEQMRQAVRDVQAERDKAATPPKLKPETRPREVGQPRRQKLQAWLFGAP